MRSVTKAVLTLCVRSRSRALAEQRGRGDVTSSAGDVICDVILGTPDAMVTPTLPERTSVQLSLRDLAGEGAQEEGSGRGLPPG